MPVDVFFDDKHDEPEVVHVGEDMEVDERNNLLVTGVGGEVLAVYRDGIWIKARYRPS